MDDFDKTTIRISVKQAEILLDLCRQISTSDMTIEDVYALNAIHYSLQAVADKEEHEQLKGVNNAG